MHRLLAPLALAMLVLTATALAGGDNSRQEARYTVLEERPDRSTGERFEVDYRNPDDPDAKPPAVRKVVTVLPRRARFDTSAPRSCTATDAELMAKGADACPAGSAVGGGVITVDTGAPGPERFLIADVEFFNNDTDPDGEFIYVNTARDTEARTVIRADVTHRKRITEAPMLPGTPPDGGAIDTVDVTIEEVSRRVDGQRRNYVTTPPVCPDRGFWWTKVRFVYDDAKQVERTRAHCEG